MNSASTSYQVEARMVGKGVARGGAKESEIEFDMGARPSMTLMGPADLLTLAFAACVLKNVERFAGILKFQYSGAKIKVRSERQEAPPKMTQIHYELELVSEEKASRVELLHRNIRKYGTIYNTLAVSCKVEGSVVARRGQEAKLVSVA